MHEWALADSIVGDLLNVSANRGGCIKQVIVTVGELIQLDHEILRFALEQVSKDTRLEKVEYEIVEQKASFSCNNCGRVWGFKDIEASLLKTFGEENPMHLIPDAVQAFVRCPSCGSPDFETPMGRDVSFSYIEEGS